MGLSKQRFRDDILAKWVLMMFPLAIVMMVVTSEILLYGFDKKNFDFG